MRESLASKDSYLEPIVSYMKELVLQEDTVLFSDINFKEPFAVGNIPSQGQSAPAVQKDQLLRMKSDSYVSQEILNSILQPTEHEQQQQLQQLPSPDTSAGELDDLKQLLDSSVDMFSGTTLNSDTKLNDFAANIDIQPALKKRKTDSDGKPQEDIAKVDQSLAPNGSAIGTSQKMYIEPKKLELQSLRILVGLVNSIGINDSSITPDIKQKFYTRIKTEDDDDIFIVNDDILERLQDCLQRIFGMDEHPRTIDHESEPYNNNIFSTDYLIRIESLCAEHVNHCLSVLWGDVLRSMSSEITQHLISNLRIAQSGLRASIIIFLIFLSGRREQSLYLEEYMSPAVELLSRLVEDLFIPMFSEGGFSECVDAQSFQLLQNQVYGIFNLLVQDLKCVDRYIGLKDRGSKFAKTQGTFLNEYLITKLEYMSTLTIFAYKSDSISNVSLSEIIAPPSFELLKSCCTDVLVSIFKSYDNQRTFILEEVLNNFNIQKLDSNKTTARQFKLSFRGINVQLFTILILRLVQAYDILDYSFSLPIWKSFIFKASYPETFQTSVFITDPKTGKIKLSSKEKPTLYNEIVRYQKHLQAEKLSLSTICNQIASFMVTKLSETPDASYKNLMEMFIEDLLNLLSLPEWAGAETMLYSLMSILMYVFRSSKYSSAVETFSLEMVGLIGCKILSLKKKNKYADGENENMGLLIPSASISVAHFSELTLHYEFCMSFVKELAKENKAYESNFRFLLFKWFQMLEALKQDLLAKNAALINEHDRNSIGGEEDEHLEELNHIKEQRKLEKRLVSSSALFKKLFDFYSKYLEELNEKKFSFFSEDPKLSMGKTKDTTELIKNIGEASLSHYSYLLASQNLLNTYDNFLNLVVGSLNHNKIKSRTRAIKNLSSVAKRDPSIIQSLRIKKTLSNRIEDVSPLVRDAAIDLVCQYISTKPHFIEDFFKVICERICDPSIAVQRRVLKVVNTIYEKTDKAELKVLIIENLLKILHHEDSSIIDLSAKILIDIWFVPIYKELSKSVKNEFLISSQINDKVEIIVETMYKNERAWDLFEEFVQRYVLFSGNKGVSHRKKITFALHHHELVTVLYVYVEKLIDFVIQNSDTVICKEVDAISEKVEKFIGLLSVLTKCDGKLVSQDQLMLLLPYLTDDTSSSNTVCYYTLQIFRNTLPQASSLRPQFLKESQLSLLRRLTKFNVRELNEAVPCIWYLSEMDKDINKISNACISCLKLMKPFVENAMKDNVKLADPKLIRLLYLIGSFGKHCEFEKSRHLFLQSKIGLRENESVTSILAKYVISFCKDTINNQIKKIAIRNLIFICSSHANLFMSESVLRIFDNEFSKSNTLNIDVKEIIVQELTNFLIQEEKASIKRAGLGMSATTNTKLDVNVFHGTYSNSKENDGICASLVHRYLEKVLSLCSVEQTALAYGFVKFLEASVKQGFANPRLCITTVVALEFVPSKRIREIATYLHKELHDKHETLIESRYVEGLKIAASRAAQQIKPLLLNPEYFRGFYQIICSSRASKRKFWTSLGKSIINMNVKKCAYAESKKYAFYIQFIVTHLSHTTLSTLEEYYIICQYIDRILSTEGLALQVEYDALHGSQKSEKDINKERQKIAFLSHSLHILLKYKKFVCKCYNIKAHQVIEFNPSRVENSLKSSGKNHFSDLRLNISYLNESKLNNNFAICDEIVGDFFNDYLIVAPEHSESDAAYASSSTTTATVSGDDDDVELISKVTMSASASESLDYDEEDGPIT